MGLHKEFRSKYLTLCKLCSRTAAQHQLMKKKKKKSVECKAMMTRVMTLVYRFYNNMDIIITEKI